MRADWAEFECGQLVDDQVRVRISWPAGSPVAQPRQQSYAQSRLAVMLYELAEVLQDCTPPIIVDLRE